MDNLNKNIKLKEKNANINFANFSFKKHVNCVKLNRFKKLLN